MAELVVIAFPNEAKAEEVRQKLLAMQKEYLIELGDAVIAVKDDQGRIKLNQLLNTTAAGAVSGAGVHPDLRDSARSLALPPAQNGLIAALEQDDHSSDSHPALGFCRSMDRHCNLYSNDDCRDYRGCLVWLGCARCRWASHAPGRPE